jgi:glycosyltransferase involved in cell wall biosynthesis
MAHDNKVGTVFAIDTVAAKFLDIGKFDHRFAIGQSGQINFHDRFIQILARNGYKTVSGTNIEFEIIVADDCSTSNLSKLPHINQLSNCQLIKPQHNLGRAKIRNFLADKSQYNHLLFLDSDSFPANNDFLKKYIEHIPQNITILGGRIYNDAQNEHHTLLTLYGSTKERNNKISLQI